jgi:hypothetical protein
LVAYYNGVRMRGQETLEGEETGYAIFVEVNLRKDKNAEHMDIPPQVLIDRSIFQADMSVKTYNFEIILHKLFVYALGKFHTFKYCLSFCSCAVSEH